MIEYEQLTNWAARTISSTTAPEFDFPPLLISAILFRCFVVYCYCILRWPTAAH